VSRSPGKRKPPQNLAVLGAAIYNTIISSSSRIINCRFTNNIVGVSGGIYNFFSSPQVTNCLFSGNSASSFGGGMFNISNSDPTVTNCTFGGNSAFDGAGIYNFDTISTGQIRNSIFWGNTVLSGTPSIGGPATPTVLFSDIEGGWAGPGSNNITVDPMFVNLLGGNLHLLTGSPCIDVASNANLPADDMDLDNDGNSTEAIPLDLDGNVRIFNITVPVVDMGAYEFQPILCLSDITPAPGGNGVVNIDDLVAVLNALGFCKGCPEDVTPPGGNGIVNIDDLVAVLNAFGPCP